MHFWRSQAISWMKKNQKHFFQIFSFFIGGTLMIFLKKIPQKSPWDFRANLKKIIRVPPMKSEKNLKFFSSIFFVQDVAWDLQKCILEIFLKNLYTILNASYFVVENFERSGPFLLKILEKMSKKFCLESDFLSYMIRAWSRVIYRNL